MLAKNNPSDDYLFLPARAGRATLEEFRRRSEADVKLTWGIPSVDDYLIPMMPGDLVTLVARPGMGKTTAMIHLARVANRVLQERGVGEKSYVVYVTWETLVEEFVAIKNAYLSTITLEQIGRGQADLVRLSDSIAASIQERIAVVGMSMTGGGDAVYRRRMPTLEDVDDILFEMSREGRKPALVFYDYLQRIPGQPGRDRSLAVSENLEIIKDLALRHRVPSVVGIQAKREVDDYPGLKMPGLRDSQWSSSIEQCADKVISLSRPILYWEDTRKPLTIGDQEYDVTERTMCMKVVKHRWGRAGKLFVLDLNPELGIMRDVGAEGIEEEAGAEVF